MTITNLADYLVSIDLIDIYLIRNIRFGLLTCEQLYSMSVEEIHLTLIVRRTHALTWTTFNAANKSNISLI